MSITDPLTEQRVKKRIIDMAEMEKLLDIWADKLLDTGKRNNLINFKDSKASSAEVVLPDSVDLFSRCSEGNCFFVYDPKTVDEDIADKYDTEETEEQKKLNREEFVEQYSHYIKKENQLLVYAQTPNPMTAVKNIAKRAKQTMDETGINVSYLAFGFMKWKESRDSNIFYNAPLLLAHIRINGGTVKEPIQIEITDDDVVVNPTFDYMLQAQFGDSLPSFNDDDTLDSYLAKASDVAKRQGWEVLSFCKLGIFSFLKLNMYEDLKENKDKILGNGNVRALLGDGRASADLANGEGFERMKNPLVELHTVVDADSSQIEAIEMAKSGKSFVLQGPPGTGKSQTITNIIAECLYDGKKVLFVSEKQAALNVVFDKLKKSGLADFCLELHSHKANKKAVIDELNRTLELPPTAVRSSAEDVIRRKAETQKRLDAYAAALHKKRGILDKSVYQLFELYSAERKYPDYKITIRDISHKGRDYIIEAETLLEQYVKYIPSIGRDYKQNPWYGFKYNTLSFEESNQLREDLETISKGYTDIKTVMMQMESKYSISELTRIRVPVLAAFLLHVADHAEMLSPECFQKGNRGAVIDKILEIKSLSDKAVSIREKLLHEYSEQLLTSVDARALLSRLKTEYSSSLKHIFSRGYKDIINTLQNCGYRGKLTYNQAIAHMEDLAQLQSIANDFEEKKEALKRAYNIETGDLYSDWKKQVEAVEGIGKYEKYSFIPFEYMTCLSAEDLRDNREQIREDSVILDKAVNGVKQAKERISRQFDKSVLDLDDPDMGVIVQKVNKLSNSFDQFNNWLTFLELLKKIEKNELSSYLDMIISEDGDPENIVGSYKKAFYKQWIESQLFDVPELSAFSRVIQDQDVRSFADKDEQQYEISKAQIQSALSTKRPDLSMVAGGSQVAVLRREGMKKRKQMPIRKLMAEIGSLIQILKPCFLMSPLSVSTFLESGRIGFDTIVFDEASQIFPQDAIGTIYRGKQLIVVGDSKQMPPSDFFNASSDIEDDDENIDITDFDSILDICSSVFDTERLAWHYRSHYEQLIAFSNMNFYNNHLITFPSSAKDRKGIGVDYYFADGVFDRKSKTNRKEAEFIVDLVFNHIKDYPERSLGVVAFSIAQQDLIDSLITKRRESDLSNEWFFNQDKAEPFFVKNLETVQGDERDTIIFSVAYAKDSEGKFYHNFGPLNRSGGERRLNVAVTRAKDNVQLVASIHYTDINLNSSGAEGVRLLRAYLDYAQNGEEALARQIQVGTEDHYDSDFEQEVCEFLRDKGFSVDTQIGCSGYKIDLGVRRSDSSDYVLAIECDGATYHNSKNARDRDRLRQQILERMGWKFYRIWSTDWYKNKANEKNSLEKAVQEALNSAPKPIKDDRADEQPKEEKSKPESKQYSTVLDKPKVSFDHYRELDAMLILKNNKNNLLPALKYVLEVEAPLSEEWYLKRIVSFFDREKVTSTVEKMFESHMCHCSDYGIVRKKGFMYLSCQNKKAQITFRVPGDKREIKYISIEELADGFYKLIRQNVSVDREGLYKTMTNLLGFTRTGENIVTRYDESIAYLKECGLLNVDGSEISIVEKNSNINLHEVYSVCSTNREVLKIKA